jgi:hypothetical protein
MLASLWDANQERGSPYRGCRSFLAQPTANGLQSIRLITETFTNPSTPILCSATLFCPATLSETRSFPQESTLTPGSNVEYLNNPIHCCCCGIFPLIQPHRTLGITGGRLPLHEHLIDVQQDVCDKC